MQIVIDTVDSEGQRRSLIVEPISCDGRILLVRRKDKEMQIPLSAVADWSPIDDGAEPCCLEFWH